MSGRLGPQLPVTRRSEPAYREQRRQKVEEYLLRKKAISGLLIPEKQTNTSNRIGKAASDKPQDKIKVLKSAKQKMEDKENANRPPWNQPSNTLEKITAASKSKTLKTTTILTNSTVGTNCSPEDFSLAIHASKDEAVEIKTYRVSFSQSFLHKRNIKEKQLIAEKQKSNASLPKKHVPGSYCGKIISSKINSFRNTLENEDAKSSLANKKPIIPSTKLAVRPPSTTSNNAVRNNIRASNLASAAKPVHATSFQKKPPMSASHGTHSKSIQSKEKQIVTNVSINNMTVQRKPDRSGPPPSLKTALCDAKPTSVPGTKRTEVPLRDVRSGTSAKSVSVTCVTKATQDSKAGNRKHVLPKESADERRIRLAEWKADKGKVIKRPPCTGLQVAQPETQTSQTEKEPVKSFWATIAEEDEQGLFSENVNKTLAECLHLTEQGYPGDEVRAMLEKLIQRVPDAKKLAKYWVCCMRLEQKGPIEKIIAVYEEAVLAGAQPKDELRHTVADIMKNNENLPKSVLEECVKEEVVGKEANSSLQNVEEAFKELNLNEEKAAISNEVIKKEETDSSVKPRQETLLKDDKKHRTKEQRKKSANCKTEDTKKEATLQFKTPDKEKEGSYLIKYNLSTTPYLESVKKMMQCEANDSAVKDIKFLTPVRRSRRLQEKLCKLPNMLKDHDPCVSSLEQLGELGAVTNAFIYRRNSALQEPTTHLEEQEEQ